MTQNVYDAPEQRLSYGCATYYPNDEGLYVPAGTKIYVAIRFTHGRLECQFRPEVGHQDYYDVTRSMYSEANFAPAAVDYGGSIVVGSESSVDLLSFGPTAVGGWFRVKVFAYAGCVLSLKLSTEPPMKVGAVAISDEDMPPPTVEWRDGEDEPVADATPPHLITDEYSYVRVQMKERICGTCLHAPLHVSQSPCCCCDNTDTVYHTEWQPKDEVTPDPEPPRMCGYCGKQAARVVVTRDGYCVGDTFCGDCAAANMRCREAPAPKPVPPLPADHSGEDVLDDLRRFVSGPCGRPR